MSNEHNRPFLARGPWWIVPLLALAAALSLAVVALVPGRWKLIPIAAGVIFLCFNFAVQLKRKKWEDDVEKTMTRYIDSQLSPLMRKVAETIAEKKIQKRREHASSVLGSVVSAASDMIGRHPVRASIFEYAEAKNTMVAHPTAFTGRGDKSVRVFSSEDPTLVAALKGKPRFVKKAENKELPYKTYMTHPIIAGGNLYGVLTIDTKNPTDITQDDEQLLRYLSAVAAIPYAREQAPSQPVNSSFEP